MNQPIKLLLVADDNLALLNLSLWLEQFPDLEVHTTSSRTQKLAKQIEQTGAEILLIDANRGTGDELIAHNDFADHDCSVLFLNLGQVANFEVTETGSNNHLIGPGTSMKDLYETIRREATRIRTGGCRARTPIKLAG